MQGQTRARGRQVVFECPLLWLGRIRGRAGDVRSHQSGCEVMIHSNAPDPPRVPHSVTRLGLDIKDRVWKFETVFRESREAASLTERGI